MLVVTQVFSSFGIGLLVGLLLGLSSAPVVGLVVGSITALLASLLGFELPTRDESASPIPRELRQTLIGVRAGTFGLACILGIFAGIYMRTHDVLSPPEPGLTERYEELQSIGFSPERARELLVPGGELALAAATESDAPTTRNTVLFSVDAETCQQIAVDRFATVSAAADYYESRSLARLARITRDLDRELATEDDKRLAVKAVVEVMCERD
jgi:hypothetical protein